VPGSIKIDSEAVKAAVLDLQALSNSTALDDALQALLAVSITSSSGSTADIAKAYGEGFSAICSSLKRLFGLTAQTLQSAEEYFTMADDELAAYMASHDGGS
jgi:hypothetical protein